MKNKTMLLIAVLIFIILILATVSFFLEGGLNRSEEDQAINFKMGTIKTEELQSGIGMFNNEITKSNLEPISIIQK